MDLKDLQDEIVRELGEMSAMSPGNSRTGVEYVDSKNVDTWTCDLHEDPSKAMSNDWLEKQGTNSKVGEVILVGTKLYWKTVLSPERMYIADLIEPDSFDKALVTLKESLTVSNAFKTPFGMPNHLARRRRF